MKGMYYLGKHKKDVIKHGIDRVSWASIHCCSARSIFILCFRFDGAFDLDCGHFSSFLQFDIFPTI